MPNSSAASRLEPTEIAPDTFVLHDVRLDLDPSRPGRDEATPTRLHTNALVIRGEQAVLVDSGLPANRERFLEDLFGLVDPEQLRWVVLTHEGVGHHGNVAAVLERCPAASLVTSWPTMVRLEQLLSVPAHRWGWIGDGEALDVGDRRLLALRPPIYDAAGTLGIWDPTTRVYWASECFGAPVHTPTAYVRDLELSTWRAAFGQFHRWISAWAEDVDRQVHLDRVERLAALDPAVIASALGPAVDGELLGDAFELLRLVPELDTDPPPSRPGGVRPRHIAELRR